MCVVGVFVCIGLIVRPWQTRLIIPGLAKWGILAELNHAPVASHLALTTDAIIVGLRARDPGLHFMDSNHRHVSSWGQAAYHPITPPQSTHANPLIMHYAAKTPLTHALKVRPPPPGLTGPAPHTRWSPLNRQPSRGLISWFLG